MIKKKGNRTGKINLDWGPEWGLEEDRDVRANVNPHTRPVTNSPISSLKYEDSSQYFRKTKASLQSDLLCLCYIWQYGNISKQIRYTYIAQGRSNYSIVRYALDILSASS